MESERQNLSIRNPNPIKLSGPSLLHHLIQSPCDGLALEYLSNNKRTSLSYQELHDAADVLAARISLASGEIEGPFVVPVLIHQSPHLYIALLAILKAGGAFCPLNVDAPPERVNFILKDVASTVVVASEELAPLIPPHSDVKVILVDRQDNTPAPESINHRIPEPNDLAYVMYTSGSTGTPKGVGISHLVATQSLLAHDLHVPEFSRFLQFASPTFDVSVFEIFFPLIRGRTLISVNRKEMLNDLPAALSEMNVDACELTPTVAASLLRSRENAPTLKLLLTIGEMLNVSVVQEFGGDDNRESLLWAMYGPTEAAIHCTLQGGFQASFSTNNIGIPLDTVSCFIIEPASSPETSGDFKLLPIGEVGELAVGGHQLADGYLNRPEQTAAAFISSPYGRIYRTGDKARMRSDGTLECLGRMSDGQVKLRGQRIELGEVQAAVLRTPGCHGAVPAVIDSILVVFCAVDGGVAEELILSHCSSWLPQFMVPGEMVLMEEFPRLPSGKVDTKRLKTEFKDRKFTEAQDDSESISLSETEAALLRVLSGVLNVEVNHRMTLAAAGVDSLVAIRLASALRAAGFEASATELLSLKTISDLCSTVQPRTQRESNETEMVDLSLLTDLDRISESNFGLQKILDLVEDILPCSSLQTAMLAETAQQPDAYWNDVELEAASGITAKEISEAVHQLAFRNEILRAGFIHHQGGFVSPVFKTLRSEQVQIVDAFHELDLSGSDELLSPLRVQIQDGGSENGTRILIRIHHAIYDGWSMDIMLSDLAGLLCGTQLPSRQQFRNFIKYSNDVPRSHSDNAMSFWTEHLLGWNKAPLPKLSARPAETNQILTRRTQIDIPPEIMERATKKTGCSPQVFFQAALALVWSGILGSSDVLIGSVTSGRTVPVDGIEEILGPCIASMPLRININNAAAILDVLTNINSSNRGIMEHCALPLSEIKRLTGLQAAESLYDVLFVYQESLYAKERNMALFKEVRHLDRLETKLLIEAEPRDHGFTVQATYHSGSFPPDFVDQLLQQVVGIFNHLLNHTEELIQSASDAVEAERSIDNARYEQLEETSDLAALFEAAVARNPQADAIFFGTSLASTPITGNILSYEALNRLSNQIANFLLGQGAKPGDVVSVVMEKSPTLYASILGIIKARCAYLPLLPSTPISRVQDIFKSAGIERCLVDKASLSILQEISDVQLLDVESCPLESFSDKNLDMPTDLSRLAYVIYTSGTTGVPKGVAVSQRNIVSNVTYLASLYPDAQRNAPRLLQSCSQAFDVSVFEIFYTWHTGMSLCAATNDDLFEDLEHAIQQFRITHLSLTPTVASLIDPKNVPDVEFLVTAGEPMTASVLDAWGELLWQGYGPSETTNICTVKKMKRGEHIEHLGWTFPNSPVFVHAPSSLEVVPIGWVGELCFGGDQVADGYLNMPELTSEKFIEHPKFGRIYRSGDLGRMLPDKSLVILGRIDDQIKLRGQRIQAGEANAVITGTTRATAAVTILVRREDGAPDQLASFYVSSSTEVELQTLEVDRETHRLLLANLQSRLPSYMIPSYLIPVSHIPLTSSGKVDRRRLQSCFKGLSHSYLESSSSTAIIQDNADWTETEVALADVIAKSLNIPGSGVNRWTPFATLGLDSVTAIGVARDISSHLASRVAISAILQNPTVAQLGRFIDEMPRNSESKNVNTFFTESFIQDVRKSFQQEQHSVAEVLPCSPLQEAMLSFGQGSYYNKILLRIHIQSEDMRHCWDEMTKRHGILRTCFVTTSDAKFPIAQVVLENWNIPWRSFDVSEPSLDGAIQEHLKLLPDPLDTKIPPLSLAIIRYKGSAFLSFVCHHALYDGVAMENLWREVEALANGKELQPSVSYEPFIQEMVKLPNDTEQFWVDHFRGFSPHNLFIQPARRQVDQCLHTISLDVPYGEIQDRHRSLGVSFLSLCQAAWANVLAVSCNISDVCFGSVVSGRTLGIEGIDRLVAPCFNTIPVRKNLLLNSRNLDLIKYFQRLNSELLRYQFTPLRQVQRVAGSQGRKLFDTLLLLQKPLQEMDATVWTLEEDSGDMDIPLVCEVIPCPNLNSVVINMHYDMGMVGEDIAASLVDMFKNFVRLMLENPSSPLPDRSSVQQAVLPLLDTLAANREKTKVTSQSHSNDEKWTETETQIQKVLSELSGMPLNKIFRNTSIFQLGLDSINAVQVASMLRRRGFSVSASDIVECQTCAKLTDRILENPANAPRPQYDLDKFSSEVSSQVSSKLPHVVDIEAILPCTPMQCAMLASFSESQGRSYLNLVSYAVDDGVSITSLVAAWKSLQSRHSMLRTGFVDVQHSDSVFAMIRHPAASEILESINISQKVEESLDVSQWKRDGAASILNTPYLPPWRVAFATASHGLVMHLLIHHALYDAQSLDAIFADLAMSLGTQTTSNFPSVEPGLRAILTESLGGQNEAQKFWEEKADLTVVNSFPVMTPLREHERVLLTHTTTSSMSLSHLQAATQKQSVSIQAVIQAAWTRILSSYLGEDSVVFGVTLSGRTMDETRDVPCPCMTTIPIVTSNRSSNAELVNAMMQYNASVHKFRFTPLNQAQKWLGHPARPVFDTLLVYQKVNKDQSITRPWNLVGDDASVDYPVSLEVVPIENDQIQFCITYFNDILPTEQAKLVVQQFDAIVAHLVTEPYGHEDGIYQVKPELFSITPAASPVLSAPVQYLHQFVEEKALSQPDAIALEFVSRFDGEVPVKQTWTYAELDSIGNRMAHMLDGVAAVRSIIAIHFDKCPEAYVSILGILKAGCAFVALDPSAPQPRKAFIMSDSMAPCLLTSSGATIDFDVTAEIIRVDLEKLQQYSPERRVLGSEFAPDATCYCLYTSGTTGTPKGCEITHDNCVQAMMAFQELMNSRTSPDSRWLQFASLHFDVSVLEQYWSWSVGITMVAAPKDLILDDLIATINRLEITHIDLTPSLARLITPADVPSLCSGVLITGGEQLKQEILDAWGPQGVIYNAYGPTEATIGVTMYQQVPINGRPSNIGRQFLNVGSYIFRQGTDIPVLRGAVGELCVSGPLVGKGYLNRQELTAERFPTPPEFEDRIYRTGDLVRILYDGCFEFLGRADDQVKLRGQRLEIGEINHVIRTGAPEVKDIATIVVRQGNGKDVLVSFLVGQQSGTGSLTLLQDGDDLGVKARAACRAKLPGYMVPTYFLILPYIPLSPNNKVEAKELKQLFQSLSHEQLMTLTALKPTSRPIDNKVSQKIISIVSEFSGVGEEHINDGTSIFDLGVDSITALQLSAAFKTRGFIECSPTVLLRNPIVLDLALALSKRSISASNNSLVRETKQTIQACHHRHRGFVCRVLDVQPKDIEYIAPCSALQEGMISRSMTDTVGGAYFNSFHFLLEGNTSVGRLQRSWNDLIASQAVLRTSFVRTSDGYVQVALKYRTVAWHKRLVNSNEDIDAFVETTRQDWVQRNNNDITSPIEFVLITTPHFRKLVVHIFHALYDGNSFELMIQHVTATYLDKPISPAPSFLEALSHGPLWRHDDCHEFWTTHLQGWKASPTLQLSAPAAEHTVSATRLFDGNILEDVRKRYKVTLHSVVMALWTSVLQQYSPNGTTVGLISAGRSIDLPNVENTIGPLFNTNPFFTKSLHGHTWASLIRHCHQFKTSILGFQHVPLKSVQKWCSSGRPLFDSLFVFELGQDVSTDESDLWKVEDGTLNPDYPLAFEGKRRADGKLQVTLIAQGQVANAAKLEEILDQIEESIASIVAEDPLQSSVDQNSHVEELNEDAASVHATDGDSFEWTDQATIIREIIATIADVPVEDITAQKTILEFGLDSIDVIKLSAKLRPRGINLSASQIMRQQTIAQMVHEIDTQQPTSSEDASSHSLLQDIEKKLWDYIEKTGLNMEDVETVLPPTPLQESMVVGMVHSNFEWYFNHNLLEVAAGIDVGKLREAWIQVINQSPILRTGFFEVADRQLEVGYCQVIFKHWTSTIEEVQVESLSEVQKLMEDAKQNARDKQATEGLFQLKLVTCGEQRFVLMSIAHALYDGWSLDLMFRHFEAIYNGESTAQSSTRAFLESILASRTEEASQFWADYLEGVSPTILPERYQPVPVGNTLFRKEVASNKTISEVSEFCKKQGISLQVLCQACWAMVLAHRTRALDITFGVIFSGRDREGIEDLMFPTMNTFALRSILHGTVSGFLKYLEASMTDIREYQAYPLRKVQAAAQTSGSQLFNSLFLLQKSPEDTSPSGPLLKSVDGASAVDYPVCVEAEALDDGLVWRIASQSQYNTEKETAELLIDLDRALGFMMGSATSDILSFQDEGVSICGFSPVTTEYDTTSASSDSAQDSGVDVEEWTESALVIRRILSYVSDIPEESIQTESNLYHLGLDSISAIKVASLLRKEGLILNPMGLIKATSITQMAHLASLSSQDHSREQSEASSTWTPAPGVDIYAHLADANISKEDVDVILPALPLQVYMICAWQNSEGSVFFPEFCYTIDGIIEIERIREAWQLLVAQTPMLRTRLLATNSAEQPFLQVIIKPEVGKDVPQPFVQFNVTKDVTGQVTIRLKIHHALYDGVSLPAMMQHFSDLLAEKQIEVDQGIQQWSQHTIQPSLEESRQKRRAFWTDYLGDIPVSSTQESVLTDKTRVSYLKRNALPDVSQLRSIASQRGISMQALFFAAYSRTLIADRGESVVFGIYLANRASDEQLALTYPTLNLVPLRVDLAANDSLVDIADRIQGDLHRIGSDGHADVGLWEIAAWTGVKVTSFVNFLSLPADPSEAVAASNADVRLVPASLEDGVPVVPTESAREVALSHPWIQKSVVRDVFPAALDVEASIKGQSLDVGVFGSRQCTSEDGAASLVEQIVSYLKEVDVKVE